MNNNNIVYCTTQNTEQNSPCSMCRMREEKKYVCIIFNGIEWGPIRPTVSSEQRHKYNTSRMKYPKIQTNERNCRNLLISFIGHSHSVWCVLHRELCDTHRSKWCSYIVIVKIYRKLESHFCCWCILVINTFDSPTHIRQIFRLIKCATGPIE